MEGLARRPWTRLRIDGILVAIGFHLVVLFAACTWVVSSWPDSGEPIEVWHASGGMVRTCDGFPGLRRPPYVERLVRLSIASKPIVRPGLPALPSVSEEGRPGPRR